MDENLSIINVTNIDSEDFEGMYGGEKYLIKSGETKPYPRFLATHLADQLKDKILIREGKDWSSEAFSKPLMDRILGQVEVPVVEQTITAPVAEPEFPEAPKEEVAVEIKTEAGFKCDVCGKVIKTEQALKMHKGRFHKQ